MIVKFRIRSLIIRRIRVKLKFSPRQKVVSLALAILAVGAVVTLGYRSIGNIFASTTTTQKQEVTIALNNWDSSGQSLFHSTFGSTAKFRCTAITFYVDLNQTSIKQAVKDIVGANSSLTLSETDLTSTINKLVSTNGEKTGTGSAPKSKAAIDKTVILDSIYNANNQLKTGCDRGTTGAESEDYAQSITIPASYTKSSAVPIAAESKTATPASTASKSSTTTGTQSTTTNTLTEETFGQISYGAKVCITSSSWKATYTKIQGTDTTGNNSSEYGYKAFQKTKDYSGSGAPDIIYQDDNSTYNRTGYVGKNWTYGLGECSASATASTTSTSGIALTVNVKNSAGSAVNDSRITVMRLDSDGNAISGVSTAYLYTDATGSAKGNIPTDGLYTENIKKMRVVAEKSGQYVSYDYDWARLNSIVTLTYTLDISDDDAKTEQTWTAAQDPSNGTASDDSFVIPVTGDNNWPGGKNSLELIAGRRSMNSSNFNGYTPVGSVVYEIEIYSKDAANQTSGTTSLNSLAVEKAKAALEGNTVASYDYGDNKPTAVVSGSIPYDQSKVVPYTLSQLQTLKSSNSAKYTYTTKGRIADNGINSEVKISNLPAGIYHIKLTKYNYATSEFIYIMNDTTNEKLVLPISPNTWAEPPSIDSGTIEKTANKDIYKANNYVYISQYPWFGWQKETDYIYTEPKVVSGVPTSVSTDGKVISGAGGNSSLQKCIENKLKSLGVGASNLSTKDVLLGTAGAWLLKQSSKQNNEIAQGAMIAGGIASLIEMAKSSNATFSVNYDVYDCVESAYNIQVPSSCRGCFNLGNIVSGNGSCSASCLLQYQPLISTLSSLSL